MIRVDIQPQWRKLANWYWDNIDCAGVGGMSIWEMLEHDYSAFKVYQGARDWGNGGIHKEVVVQFPDEASYSAFLLRWS